MLKTNQLMLSLFVLALVILIMGTSASEAKTINETDITEEITPNQHIKEINTNKKPDTDNTKTSPQRKPIDIYTDDITCNYGEIIDIPVTTDPDTVSDGIITWFIDGQPVGLHNISYEDTQIQVDTTDYQPGIHEIYIDYGVSSEYLEASSTAYLTINRAPTMISNKTYTFTQNNDILIKCSITSDNKTLTQGKLEIYDDQTLLETVNVNSPLLEFTLDKQYNQKILEFRYEGNEYYDNSTSMQLVNVQKINAKLYLPTLTAYQSQKISQAIQITSDRPVNDGKLDVYIDDTLIEEYDVTDNESTIIIDTGRYPAGNYTLRVEYIDSSVYNDCEYETVLTVKQVATVIYSNNITAHRNDTVTLRASVYNYVDETNDGMLEFLLDNESIKTGLIQNISLYEEYIIPETMEYGLHNITIKYYGNQKYAPSTTYTTLNVIKYSNRLSLRNITLTPDGRIELNVNAYSYQNTVDDGVIEYLVNGEPVGTANVTGNMTRIVLPDEFEANNNYTVTFRYTDSQKYDDDTLTENITVNKTKTETRIYKYQNTNSILNITAYVYSEDYTEINEGTIQVYLDDTLLASITVTSNKVNLEYNMTDKPEANYTIKAVYKGTKVYNQSTNTTQHEYLIPQKTIYINPSQINKAAPADTIEIKAKLVDHEANDVNETLPAKITIDTYEINTQFQNGQLNHQYKLPSNTTLGTHNITITVPETKYYKTATRNITFQVQKNSTYITTPNTIRTNKQETIIINATLNSNGEILEKNITAILKINNKTIYQGYFINGKFQYRLALQDKYTSDEYNITIKSKETTKYQSSEKTLQLRLDNRKTYITSNNIHQASGEKIIINATVHDQTTKKPVNGKATIKINNVTLTNVEVKNGQILYAYTNDYSAKTYNITIKYGGSGVHNQSQWDGQIIINRIPIKIAANNINTKAYSTINITAKILENNKQTQGTIKTAIKINNKTLDLVNTENGLLNYQYRLPDDLGSKTYTITIIAGDSRRYTNATTDINLFVAKNYKHIQADNITARTGSSIRIHANILDINNKHITRQTPVNIKLGGRTIANLNVTDGIINYEHTLPDNMKQGTYDLLIQAGETAGYLHASTNTKLKIE